jgi:phospholipase/lecithinase/hemolysin
MEFHLVPLCLRNLEHFRIAGSIWIDPHRLGPGDRQPSGRFREIVRGGDDLAEVIHPLTSRAAPKANARRRRPPVDKPEYFLGYPSGASLERGAQSTSSFSSTNQRGRDVVTIKQLLSTKLIAASALLAFLIPPAVFAGADAESLRGPSKPPFTKVVVFGDSLSDPGNLFALTGQYSVRPFAPIPSAPYLIGGFHFTNGPTWVEDTSRELRSPSGAGPALRVPHFYTNYAFGGARARTGGGSGAPDLAAQVGLYFADFSGAADASSLYVIWLGANDLRDAIEALATDRSGATSMGTVQAALGSIAQNVGTLWAAGARTFLIPNAPDLAVTPALLAQPPQVQAAAAQLSAAYNAGLAQALAGLQAQLPQTTIVRLDVFTLLHAVIAAPKLYGFTNTTQPCLTFGVVAGAICSDPRDYVFWDAIHPTAAVHRVLANMAEGVLGD